MADEPQDLTIKILREIQATLFNHDLRFERIEQRFEKIERRLDNIDNRLDAIDGRFDRLEARIDSRFDEVDRRLGEVLDTAVTALGTAGHVKLRQDKVQSQISEFEHELRDVKDRLRRLEEKV